MRTPANLINDLEKIGASKVRQDLLRGIYGNPDSLVYNYVYEWLCFKDAELVEARAEESLSISRRALRISKWAIIIAIISSLVAIIIAWFNKTM